MLVQCAVAAVGPTLSDVFTSPIDALLDPSKKIFSRFAEHAIAEYRRNFSATKGYKCACGAVGCMTCSTVGIKAFKKYGAAKALGILDAQLKKCGRMADIFNMAAVMPVKKAVAAIKEKYGIIEHRAHNLINVAQTYMNEHGRKPRQPRKEKYVGARSYSGGGGSSNQKTGWCGSLDSYFALNACGDGLDACGSIGHHGGGAMDCTPGCDAPSCDIGGCG
ncbi:MAG TPA: hypothetical protein VIN59_00555 [Alphaproteobacteria bacterium]